MALAGELIHQTGLGLSFRVCHERSITLAVEMLGERGRFWVTIEQWDDERYARLALILALVLLASGRSLIDDVIADLALQRREVAVKIVGFSAGLRLGLEVDIEDLGPGGAVTRPTDLKTERPTLVVARDGVLGGPARAFLALLASTLREIAVQFVGDEIGDRPAKASQTLFDRC